MKLEPLPICREETHHKYFWKPTQEWLAYSTTRVTGAKKTLSQLRNIEKTRSEWEPRGKHVHYCLEQFLKGDPSPDPGEYENWVRPFLAHPFWETFEPWAVEYMLCDLKKSVGGQLDVLGYDNKNKQVVLLDLKTQSRITASKYNTDAQLGSYVHGLIDHHRLTIDNCRTMWSRPGKAILGQSQDVDQCCQAWADSWDYFQAQQKIV